MNCDTCQDTGEVTVSVRALEGGEWGNFDVEVPCPDCSEEQAAAEASYWAEMDFASRS